MNLETHEIEQKKSHDIKAALSALSISMEAIAHEWESNPQLVERIIPLAIDKFTQLQNLINDYHRQK